MYLKEFSVFLSTGRGGSPGTSVSGASVCVSSPWVSSGYCQGRCRDWCPQHPLFTDMLVKAKVTQSCPVLSDPMDCSPPGSSVHEILQAEHWSGSPCPPPRGLPEPGIKPRSPALQADSLPSEPPRNDIFCSHSGEIPPSPAARMTKRPLLA